MTRRQWVVLASLGGGCAIAWIVIGVLGAMFLRTPTSLIPAVPTGISPVSTRPPDNIPINQPINPARSETPLALPSESAGALPTGEASATPVPAATTGVATDVPTLATTYRPATATSIIPSLVNSQDRHLGHVGSFVAALSAWASVALAGILITGGFSAVRSVRDASDSRGRGGSEPHSSPRSH